MNGTLEQEIKQWADSRWPTRTLASRLRKLGGEVGVVAGAVVTLEGYRGPSEFDMGRLRDAAARGAADCAIVLSDICSMLGYSLSAVMREKFAEVQARPVGGDDPRMVALQRPATPIIDVEPIVCLCQGFYKHPNCPVHGRGGR